MNPDKMRLRLPMIEIFGSQADFGKAVGRDEPFVSRVVNGRKRLSDDEKALWAKKLGRRVQDLFPEVESARN